MNLCWALAVLAFGAVISSATEQAGKVTELQGRSIVATLFLSNPYDAGDWGIVDICPENSFVHGFEVKFNPPGEIDETAVNAVKLYCSTEEHHDDGYLESATAPEGTWYGMRVCAEQYLTGFRAKVLEYQGVFTDDVAVQDFEAQCNFGQEVIGGINVEERFNDGAWSAWAVCPQESAVCGLQTRVEVPQLADDDTAVTDINLFCCPRAGTNSTVNVNYQ